MNLPLALSIAWAGIIFGASAVPGESLPVLPTSDLLAHFLEYLVLGFLLFWWRSSGAGRPKGTALAHATLLGSFYGLSDELHQFFVPGRIPDPADWVFDTLGVATGGILFIILTKAIGTRDKNPGK